MLGDVIFQPGIRARAVPRRPGANPSMERAHQHLVWSYSSWGRRTASCGGPRIPATRERRPSVGPSPRRRPRWGHLEARQTWKRLDGVPGRPLPWWTSPRWMPGSSTPTPRSPALAASGDAATRDRSGLSHHGGSACPGRRVRAGSRLRCRALWRAQAGDPEGEAVALRATLLRALYLGDADGARRIAARQRRAESPRRCSRSSIRCSGHRGVRPDPARRRRSARDSRWRSSSSAPGDSSPRRAAGRAHLAIALIGSSSISDGDCWMGAKQDGKASRACAWRSPPSTA